MKPLLWNCLIEKNYTDVQYFLKTIKSHLIIHTILHVCHTEALFWHFICSEWDLFYPYLNSTYIFHNLELGLQPSRCQY